MADKRRRGANDQRLLALIIGGAMLLGGCGFHLRGQATQLPPELSTLRVMVQGNVQANDPLLGLVRDTLRLQSGARIVEDGDVPSLVLSDEHVESQVVSIQTATAKASEYRLRYSLNFALRDAASKPLLGPHTIRLQREYTFDPTRVLAKEHEERELLRELRRDAVQQLVRRIAKTAGK